VAVVFFMFLKVTVDILSVEKSMALWEQWQCRSSVDWFATFLVCRLQHKWSCRLHQTESVTDT